MAATSNGAARRRCPGPFAAGPDSIGVDFDLVLFGLPVEARHNLGFPFRSLPIMFSLSQNSLRGLGHDPAYLPYCICYVMSVWLEVIAARRDRSKDGGLRRAQQVFFFVNVPLLRPPSELPPQVWKLRWYLPSLAVRLLVLHASGQPPTPNRPSSS